jgi:hypothetical protein
MLILQANVNERLIAVFFSGSTMETNSQQTMSSDEAVSKTMQQGLENIVVYTGAGLLMGGLAGVVLARGGASGARKAMAGLGGGIGLGSAWTRTSRRLEELLQESQK